MSFAIDTVVEGAEVHEASSLESPFKKTKMLTKDNESTWLGLNDEPKMMLLLKNASFLCQVIVPTYTEKKQHVVMIIKQGVVALYRLEKKPDTLRRVPDLVKFFKHELGESFHKLSWETGFRMILASRENEPDEEYHQVYSTLGDALCTEFGHREVTCHRYQDGSSLRVGFVGDPNKWPSCDEEKAGGNRNYEKINYLNVPLSVYSFGTG